MANFDLPGPIDCFPQKFGKMSSRGHSQDRALSQERETPFSGYGDRVGSGVAYASTQWRGGEVVLDSVGRKASLSFVQLVTDPALVTKSLKPRRFYYAPIGDGVVAADGVELKRLPPDLTPKVEVIQQRIVEKGPGGKAGVRVTEKTWSSGGAIPICCQFQTIPILSGGDSDSALAYGNTQMGSAPPAADAGRNVQQPRPQGDPFANLGDQLGGPRPASTQSAPPTKNGFEGPPKEQPKDHWGGPRDAGPGPGANLGAGPGAAGPGIGSTRSTPGLGHIPATNGGTPSNLFNNEFPHSGRTSGVFGLFTDDLICFSCNFC